MKKTTGGNLRRRQFIGAGVPAAGGGELCYSAEDAEGGAKGFVMSAPEDLMREHKFFGANGFHDVVERTAFIEKMIGIYGLEGYTPTIA